MAKLKPCTSTSGRHKWKHIKNVERIKHCINSAHFMMLGVYECTTCGLKKNGSSQ